MNCDFKNKIGAYHDGELDPAVCDKVEMHLAECPVCMAELIGLKAMSQLFAAMPEPRLSQITMHRLHNRAEGAMEEGLIRYARVLSGIAACILVAASAGLIYRNISLSNIAAPAQPVVAVSEAPP